MIDISALRDLVGEGRDWAMVTPDGTAHEPVVPPSAGAATLLVSEVTEAVKRVGDDGLIEGSVDRESLWVLRAFLLNRVVLARLDPAVVDAATLLDTVPDTGIGWQVVIADTGS